MTTTLSFEARPRIPAALDRLEELAGNLAYAWDRDIRRVFWRLDQRLWLSCENNPKLVLRRIPQATIDHLAEDRDFLEDYHHALSSFDSYMASGRRPEIEKHLHPEHDLVAYFCAEFGLHESLPIYSGGLGILAGDHCKAISDLGVPFIAVGLLYRQGYFTQTIDAQGRQQANAHTVDFDELPIRLCRQADGGELRVTVELGERDVQLRIWEAKIGHVSLILLDADVPENGEADRAITDQLYGGDSDTRIQQETVLGVGGVRALRALGRAPTVWHINEGHAAFMILERIREGVAAGLPFDAALEAVAAGTVFTTHTPVPAGHDIFHHAQMRWFLGRLLGSLGTEEATLLALGADQHGGDRFNMTSLALRGSRFHNGVSKIHGGVASRMEAYLWPQIPPEENPIGHVTNGVHLHTFIARAWTRLFHDSFRAWRNGVLDPNFWRCIDSIPYDRYVAVRRQLKRDLLGDIAARVRRQLRRNGVPETIVARATRYIGDPNSKALVLGFARRFATYKRATLILQDEERLARLLNHPQRPAILIFAGKAHPKDQPGQALIQKLYETSMKPQFIGRLIMVEGYDMLLARNLVQGCDVWLNNPEYPMEASGTSGEKAGINGVVNVSVLDGWWDEGYVAEGQDGPNGFAIEPVDPRYWYSLLGDEIARRRRDEEEARQLLDILEGQVVPLYYGPDNEAYAPEWVRISKNSMKTLIPRFNSARMVMDYVHGFYGPAARQTARFTAAGHALAREYAAWKQKLHQAWGGVSLQAPTLPQVVGQGAPLTVEVAAGLNGLAPTDVIVECLLGVEVHGRFTVHKSALLHPQTAADGQIRFVGSLEPLAGRQCLRVRMRPTHPAMSHPGELGAAVWA
ncbi:alpha-glucan family phosphorylase [Solimonas flava]|uniref:alpha-glucan family phosphorylase n=1 Tax=Solimonas flava TaxID=415849 RepID=UPI000412C48A|nr:alpha-glucan family phosphorylase [Solimonas flava]